MPQDQDHYKSLGVNKNASPREVRSAYHSLAKQHHPDVGGNEEKFKEIQNAYDTIGNTKKRAEYDSGGGKTANRSASPRLGSSPTPAPVSAPAAGNGSASTQEMAKASDLASAKALSKWAIRKAAMIGMAKAAALKKVKNKAAEKLTNPGGGILAGVMALIPAMLHDLLDVTNTIVLTIFQVVGIPLEIAADGSAVGLVVGAVKGLVTGGAVGAITAVLLPLFIKVFGVALAAKAIIVLGWALSGAGWIIGIVLTGAVWYLTAGKIKSGLQNLGFGWKIFKYLFVFLLGIDNVPFLGWLPAHTGGVVAFIGLLLVDKMRAAATGEEEEGGKENAGAPTPATA